MSLLGWVRRHLVDHVDQPIGCSDVCRGDGRSSNSHQLGGPRVQKVRRAGSPSTRPATLPRTHLAADGDREACPEEGGQGGQVAEAGPWMDSGDHVVPADTRLRVDGDSNQTEVPVDL